MRVQQVRGYSLIEMLIVVALLALIAAAAAPSFVSDDGATLDQAADRVASAFRFARSEAIRTGQPHGVTASMFSQFVKVYRLDDSVNPPVVVYDVRDPMTKQIYDLRFGDGSSEPAISTVYFKFDGLFPGQTFLGFSGFTAVPKYNDSGTVRMLESGYIRLSHESRTRTIVVSPMTARVTIQ